MKIKDITPGDEYFLSTNKNSTMGCAAEYFTKFKNRRMVILKKMNNFHSNNNVLVQGYDPENLTLVNFWCSAYDLKRINRNET